MYQRGGRLTVAEMNLSQPPGARGVDGFGITNSYWADEDSIRAWKAVVSHAAAQRLGQARWYENYQVRIARVERAYGFDR